MASNKKRNPLNKKGIIVAGTPTDKRLTLFEDIQYLTMERWWSYQQNCIIKRDRLAFISRGEFVDSCIRHGIRGTLDPTKPVNTKALEGLYEAILEQPDPVLWVVLGPTGFCSPRAVIMRIGVQCHGADQGSKGEKERLKVVELDARDKLVLKTLGHNLHFYVPSHSGDPLCEVCGFPINSTLHLEKKKLIF